MMTPTWYPSSRQLRQFAAAAIPGFGLVAFMLWKATGSLPVAGAVAGLGAAAGAVGLVMPGAVRPLYVLLVALSLPIGWLVSNLLLRVIFYGAFTPLGWLFRLMGRDALQIRNPPGRTYWRPYQAPRDVASYFRQG